MHSANRVTNQRGCGDHVAVSRHPSVCSYEDEVVFCSNGEKLIVFPHAVEGSSNFGEEKLPACSRVCWALMKALLFVYFPSCVLKMHSLKI